MRPGGPLSYFARHATAANLLLVLLLVAGMAAVPNMRAQFFPDVIIDNVRVNVDWEGAGAEDVDAAIVQVLEPALLAVEGVEAARPPGRPRGARASRWNSSRAGTWRAPPTMCRRRSMRSPPCPRMPRSPR